MREAWLDLDKLENMDMLLSVYNSIAISDRPSDATVVACRAINSFTPTSLQLTSAV